MRCHPFLYNEMISIQAGNVKDFDKNFFGHIGLFLTKRVRWFTLGIKGLLLGFTGIFYTPNLICRYSVKMERISTKFAFLADLILLIYGGDFKKKEKLSSRFADVLSSLYMMSCILRRFKIEGEQKDHQPIVIYSLENYLGIIDKNLTEIYANLSLKKWIGKIIKIFLLLPPPCPEGSVANDKLTYKIVKTTLADESFFKSMFSDVFVSKDKNDRFTMLHNAFKDNARGSEIIKKVRSLKISYEEAMKRGVLTSEEYEFISKWQELVDEIMQVDDFELKSNAFTS
jgi:acyl-CoA dehydrogenase